MIIIVVIVIIMVMLIIRILLSIVLASRCPLRVASSKGPGRLRNPDSVSIQMNSGGGFDSSVYEFGGADSW